MFSKELQKTEKECQDNNDEEATQFYADEENLKKQQLEYEKQVEKDKDTGLKLPKILNNNRNAANQSKVRHQQLDLPQLKEQKDPKIKNNHKKDEKIAAELQNKSKVQQQNKEIVQNVQEVKTPQQFQELNQPAKLKTVLQKVACFDPSHKSNTILFQDIENTSSFQNSFYYQNHKLVLTEPIKSAHATCKFKVQNIKYCIGFGIALREVIIKHEYDYQSEGNSELSHGLYIVTSQGYSWSHSQKSQDDIARPGFNQMHNGLTVEVNVQGEQLEFKWKRGQFKLTLPSRIREKYTLCFCAYLHEKEDAISICK